MKLKINKACDLSSISVLPPRRSGGMSFGGDGLVRSQPSQIRSQSQQSFSQGMSLSQLSQGSLDEALINDQRIGSQEKDSSKISSLAPIASTREESQIQISRTSSNLLRRWNAASSSDNRFPVSEEFEHKLRLIESSISRVAVILDSVQSDVMQVNRAVKELSLDAGGIMQKIGLLENSIQQMLKLEDGIKAFVGGSLSSISDQLIKNSSSDKLNEIVSAVTTLHEQIGARLAKVDFEVCRTFSKQVEVLNAMQSREEGVESPDVYPTEVQTPVHRDHMDAKQFPKGNLTVKEVVAAPLMNTKQRFPMIKSEGKSKSDTFKMAHDKKQMTKRHENRHQKQVMQEEKLRIIIDSEDESDGTISCLVLNKETGKQNNSWEEVQQETMKILKKARKRKRREMNSVALE